MAIERSRAARQRAEDALVELAIVFGDHALDLIVIGGLNPDFLAPAAPAPHLGTTDVDILLELGFIGDRDELDFSWLAPALTAAGFEPRNDNDWQWDKSGDDIVRVDILCDVADSPDQTIALPGATDVAAKNLAGPSGALASPVTRELEISEDLKTRYPHGGQTVTLRFASLGGYLLAKAAAVVGRTATKDIYDFMYVVLYNPSEPAGAARAIEEAVTELPPHHTYADDIRSVLRGFEDRDYADVFAGQMRRSGDDSTIEQLALEARQGARALGRALTQPH